MSVSWNTFFLSVLVTQVSWLVPSIVSQAHNCGQLAFDIDQTKALGQGEPATGPGRDLGARPGQARAAVKVGEKESRMWGEWIEKRGKVDPYTDMKFHNKLAAK